MRATALTLLGEFPAPGAAETIERSINDKDPLVRRSAAESLELFEPGTRLRLGTPLLDDPLLTVRMAAARVLSSVRQQASPQQRDAITRGLEEYAEAQRFNGDRAEGQLNLAWYHVEQGQFAEAETALFSVIEAAPRFTPATGEAGVLRALVIRSCLL